MDAEIRRRLTDAAIEASKRSHSPYSGYAVGAAVLTDGGAIYSGTNVENASYGATMCAERVALFKAVSEGGARVVALVVYAEPSLPYPCGMCLQALSEFTAADVPVCLVSGRETREFTFENLFPHPFEG
ncbi:MAG: cytidine deaminase [Clostridia bacterium]|nr:cytidine deaminase [Clostridia bacterium]